MPTGAQDPSDLVAQLQEANRKVEAMQNALARYGASLYGDDWQTVPGYGPFASKGKWQIVKDSLGFVSWRGSAAVPVPTTSGTLGLPGTLPDGYRPDTQLGGIDSVDFVVAGFTTGGSWVPVLLNVYQDGGVGYSNMSSGVAVADITFGPVRYRAERDH